MTPSPQEIVIIGAARSGTNMLRDALCSTDRTATWPCDEINYIWRHYNRTWPDDEIPIDLATPRVATYVKSQFMKVALKTRADTIVEKTCANSLRVPFLNRLLPEAKFVFLVRDGRDATASAMTRWVARMDLPYVLRKARFVPRQDLLYYGSRFLRNQAFRVGNREKRLRFWGPRFKGFNDYVATHSLWETCATQWQRSVESASEALSAIDADRVLSLQYEDLVRSPAEVLRRVFAFIGIANGSLEAATRGITAANIGKWQAAIDDATLELIDPILGPTLEEFGYA